MFRSFILLLLPLQLALAHPVIWPDVATPRAEWRMNPGNRAEATPEWQDFLVREPGLAIMDWDKRFPAPHRVLGGDLLLPGGPILDAADLDARLRTFTDQHKDLLAVDGSGLHLEYAGFHGGVWYAHYQQRIGDTALLHAEVTFRVSPSGRVMLFGSDAVGDAPLHTAQLDRAAQEASLSALLSDSHVELFFDWQERRALPLYDEQSRSWSVHPVDRVRVTDAIEHHVQYMTLSAVDGSVLESRNGICHITISGNLQVLADEHEPSDPDEPLPMAHAWITVEGVQTTTDINGDFTVEVPGAGPWTVSGSFRGDYANVNREDGSDNTFALVMEEDGEQLLITSGQIQERDAYVHTTRVHNWIKAMDPSFTGLDEDLPVNININQTCNAFWNGSSINFFVEGGGCPNTARVAGVVYHEYGHGLNDRQFIQAGSGFGMENGAMHEGLADVTSIYLQDESFVAPGWNIRNLNNSQRYPEDIVNQVHSDGRIIGGAMYDTRQLLDLETVSHLYHFARWGRPDDPEQGRAFFEYFLELLVADDDNGDLSDQTPHYAEINQAFNEHGIGSDLAWTVTQFQVAGAELIVTPDEAIDLVFSVDAPDWVGVDGVSLHWRVEGEEDFNEVEAQLLEGDWVASLPAQPLDTWVEYYGVLSNSGQVDITTPNGAPEQTFRVYFGYGSVQRLDFESESAELSAQWPWEWGIPFDGPGEAHSGDNLWGTNLSGNYGDMQDVALVFPERQVSGGGPAALRFMHWHELESGWDGGNVEISVNGGDWMPVPPAGGYDFTTPDNSARPNTDCFTGQRGWSLASFDLGPWVQGGDWVSVRLNLITDSAVTSSGWYIDDMEFVGFAGESDFVHEPLPDTEDTSQMDFLVEALLNAPLPPEAVTLYWRVDEGETLSQAMNPGEGNSYSSVIPGPFDEQTVYYRMEATGAGGYFDQSPPFEGEWHSFLVGEDREDPLASWITAPAGLVGNSAYWNLSVEATDNLGVSAVGVYMRSGGDWEPAGELALDGNGLWSGIVDLESLTQELELKAVAVDAGTLANTGETAIIGLTPAAGYHEDFNRESLQGWELEGEWQTSTTIAHEGSHSLAFGAPGEVPVDVIQNATFAQDFDLRALPDGQVPVIQFNLLMNLENGDDWLRVQLSEDREEWTTVWEATGFVGGWAEQEIALGEWEGVAGVALRFQAETDGDNDNGGSTLCLVDDLHLQTTSVGFDGNALLPEAFRLSGAWPNPFNPTTTVAFELPRQAAVGLHLYNLAGQRVLTLLEEDLPAGTHRVTLDGAGLASGVYIVDMQAPGARDQLKVLLLK